MTSRNIVTCIVLSIITCGIYGIYWMVVMNDDSKKAANDPNGATGATFVLLCLFTCGIYSIYWYFNMGKRMQTAMQNAGLQAEDRSIMFLILTLVGLGIVNMVLIQNDLNTIAESGSSAQY